MGRLTQPPGSVAQGVADHNDLVERLDTLTSTMHGHLELVSRALRPSEPVWSGLALLDSSGIWSLERHKADAIMVVNLQTATITVTAATRQALPPTRGPGVWQIPAGCALLVNATSTAWTLYGTAAGLANVELIRRHQIPMFGASGSAGGGGGTVNGGTP